MGQKVNQISFRMANVKTFPHFSSWHARSKDAYSMMVVEDAKIRKYFDKMKQSFGIAYINIERKNETPYITLNVSRASTLLGKKVKNWESIVDGVKKIINKECSINIVDVRNSDANAQIVANVISEQISKRVPYKKAIKSAMKACMKSGAIGVKVICSGRLNGAEIARSEKFQEGAMSLHRINANIDYALGEAKTIYGIIGLRVWVYQKSQFFN